MIYAPDIAIVDIALLLILIHAMSQLQLEPMLLLLPLLLLLLLLLISYGLCSRPIFTGDHSSLDRILHTSSSGGDARFSQAGYPSRRQSTLSKH